MLRTKKSAAFFILFGMSLILAGCLTGQRPHLGQADLVQLDGLAGHYYLTVDTNRSPSAEVRIEAQDDGSYLYFLIEDGKEREGAGLAQLLRVGTGTTLVVLSKADGSDDGAGFATLSPAANGRWVLNMLSIAETHRNNAFETVVQRHGATISFKKGLGKMTENRLEGARTAQQLRGIFSDPDFLAATKVLAAVELAPKG